MKILLAILLISYSFIVYAQSSSGSLDGGMQDGASGTASKGLPSAAGTSTTSTSPEDQIKPLEFFLSVTPSANSLDTQSIQVLSNFGMSYKVSDKLSFGLSQTFETLNAGSTLPVDQREMIDRTNFRAAYSELSVSSAIPGLAGTGDMPVSISYRIMSGDAVLTQKSDYISDSAWLVGNLSIPYSITPQFDISVDTQIRHVFGKSVMDTNRMFVIPKATYTLNQVIGFYQSVGLISNYNDNLNLRRSYERVFLATGMGIKASKNLSFDFNINQDKAVYASPNSGVDVTNFSPYQSHAAITNDRTFDDVYYETTVALTF